MVDSPRVRRILTAAPAGCSPSRYFCAGATLPLGSLDHGALPGTHTGWLIVRARAGDGCNGTDIERRSRTYRKFLMDWDAEMLRTVRCVAAHR